MPDFPVFALICPAGLLVAAALVPSRRANTLGIGFCRSITRVAAVQFFIALLMAAAYAIGAIGGVDARLWALEGTGAVALSVYYDGVSSLMLALVSFIGWVICRYSIRYLDGESTHGQYFRWTGFTIGSVSLLVISGNLLMFFVCWIMTSLGLHRLLLHYGHRPAAQRAAWTKFTISRLGDAALLGAIATVYSHFGTLEFSSLFASIDASAGGAPPAVALAGFLIVVGAVTKSAQFPFHTWLPLTMETPTPVSALMHAGIVNAGGYLVIRTSPLLALTPWALSILAIVGAVTACFAAVVMLTQTSVKKSLAYSTIAQMGFMMLQCGLGAFSAAMIHILAHSLYKAHAFLSSGSVMSHRAATAGSQPPHQDVAWTKLAVVGTLMVAVLAAAFLIAGVDVAAKPGGMLLGGILCLALTSWIGQVMRVGSHRLLVRSLLTSGLLCLVYVAGFVAVDKTVAASVPDFAVADLGWVVAAIVITGFAGMFVLHAQLSRGAQLLRGPGSRTLHAWYVHASNGFYVENGLRRVFGPLSSN